MTRQTLYAGTKIHFCGAPVVLVNDTEVETATDLKWWQDNVVNAVKEMKDPDDEE